jgi:trans-2,3-dihydro-3-hydroxyanthranilate isomerase
MSQMNRREFAATAVVGFAGIFGDPDRLRQGYGGPPKLHAKAERVAPQLSGQPSPAYRYVHLDVFTDRRLQGNQLFVFVQPAGLDTDAMQTLTRESNLSECTFVFPPEQPGTDHRVRIFTRTAETPFAGHPTIGTAFALAHTGMLKPGLSHTTFGLGVGPTNIDLEWKDGRLAFAWMTQQKPTFGKTIADRAALAAAIGVDAGAIDPRAPAQEVYSGSTFFIVPLTTRKAVDAAVADRASVDALFNAAGIQRRGLYIFSTERGADDATAYSRLLGTGGIEDPATGSAAGPAGCFIAKHGFVPPDRAGAIVFVQGVLVRRPSRLHVRVAMSGTDVTGVKVGGASVVVGEGAMAV